MLVHIINIFRWQKVRFTYLGENYIKCLFTKRYSSRLGFSLMLSTVLKYCTLTIIRLYIFNEEEGITSKQL